MPVAVGQLAQLVLVAHRAAGGRGAEERAAEARALLVGPVDEPDRDGRRALLGDPSQHLGAGDDVEAAVEPAAVRHRVDVPADQDGALRLAAQRPPVVAGSVALALEREPVEEPVEPRARRVPGVRPRDPLGAVLVARELLELAQLGDDATGIEGHGATLDDLGWPRGVPGASSRTACKRPPGCGTEYAWRSRPQAGRGLRRGPRRALRVLHGYRQLYLSTGWTRPFKVDEYAMPRCRTSSAGSGSPPPPSSRPRPRPARQGAFTARGGRRRLRDRCIVGIAIGVVFHFSNLMRRGFQPYAVGSQTVPILAIAPIVVIWLGGRACPCGCRSRDQRLPHVLPGRGQHAAGPRLGRPAQAELMRSYAATEWSTLGGSSSRARFRTCFRPSRSLRRRASSAR